MLCLLGPHANRFRDLLMIIWQSKKSRIPELFDEQWLWLGWKVYTKKLGIALVTSRWLQLHIFLLETRQLVCKHWLCILWAVAKLESSVQKKKKKTEMEEVCLWSKNCALLLLSTHMKKQTFTFKADIQSFRITLNSQLLYHLPSSLWVFGDKLASYMQTIGHRRDL